MDLGDLRIGQRVMVVSERPRGRPRQFEEVEVHRLRHPDTGAVSITVVALDGSGSVYGPFLPADLDVE